MRRSAASTATAFEEARMIRDHSAEPLEDGLTRALFAVARVLLEEPRPAISRREASFSFACHGVGM
jgi:hypothetical protein